MGQAPRHLSLLLVHCNPLVGASLGPHSRTTSEELPGNAETGIRRVLRVGLVWVGRMSFACDGI